MNLSLMVNVVEFANEDERLAEAVVCEPTVYEDGTVEFGVTISGKGHRVYVRFSLADLVRIAMTTDQREEAP